MARSKLQLKKECAKVMEVLRGEAKELMLGTKDSLPRLEAAKSDLAEYSYWAQMEFREYVRRQLETRPSVSAVAMINNGARMLGISPVTAKRYMNKMRADNGPFSGLGDIVTINPRYKPPEEDDYWLDVKPAKTDSLAVTREMAESDNED